MPNSRVILVSANKPWGLDLRELGLLARRLGGCREKVGRRLRHKIIITVPEEGLATILDYLKSLGITDVEFALHRMTRG
jgi:hypothetical protein